MAERNWRTREQSTMSPAETNWRRREQSTPPVPKSTDKDDDPDGFKALLLKFDELCTKPYAHETVAIVKVTLPDEKEKTMAFKNTSPGNHPELHFIEWWREKYPRETYAKTSMKIKMYMNYSPCPGCAELLETMLIDYENVELIIHFLSVFIDKRLSTRREREHSEWVTTALRHQLKNRRTLLMQEIDLNTLIELFKDFDHYESEDVSCGTRRFTDDILKEMSNNEILRKVTPISIDDLSPCCKSTFNSLAVTNSGELCRKTLQFRGVWLKARKLRITGSRIHKVYTCTQNPNLNWEDISSKFFGPNEYSNKFARRGISHEPVVRRTYESKKKVRVVQCGIIVHPDYRWVGYSPDGLIFENNEPERLIKIHSVETPESKPITECLQSCKFLDEEGYLIENQRCYGQIQLGMLLCNVSKCDFIIFASSNKSIHVIEVPFNENFALDMFNAVQEAYINKMLQYICEHKGQHESSTNQS